MLGGWTTTIITNPLDVCRARLQVRKSIVISTLLCEKRILHVALIFKVQRLPSLFKTFSILWGEEGYKVFTKGLSARMAQSGVFSTCIILGYESIKRLSISDDFRDLVRW